MAASERSWYAYSSQYFRLLWREGVGMQGDGQMAGAPAMDQLYFGSNSGWNNKIGVAGSRFLRGVAENVNCDEEYEEEE